MNKKEHLVKNIKSVSFKGTTRLFQIENWKSMILKNGMYVFIVDNQEVKFKESQILIKYK